MWLKALLVHGARSGEAGDAYQALFRTPWNGNKLAEYLARLLGFGRVHSRCGARGPPRRRSRRLRRRNTRRRGRSRASVPSPTVTQRQAWMASTRCHSRVDDAHPPAQPQVAARTPVVQASSPSRSCRSGATKTSNDGVRIGRPSSEAPSSTRSSRAEKAAAFVDGDEVVVHVSCREDAKVLSGAVPYALAVTLKVNTAT